MLFLFLFYIFLSTYLTYGRIPMNINSSIITYYSYLNILPWLLQSSISNQLLLQIISQQICITMMRVYVCAWSVQYKVIIKKEDTRWQGQPVFHFKWSVTDVMQLLREIDDYWYNSDLSALLALILIKFNDDRTFEYNITRLLSRDFLTIMS